jgi:hypothetical protein
MFANIINKTTQETLLILKLCYRKAEILLNRKLTW